MRIEARGSSSKAVSRNLLLDLNLGEKDEKE
jgi:hypothetical protein